MCLISILFSSVKCTSNYSEVTQFESRPGYRLMGMMIFIVFLNLPKRIQNLDSVVPKILTASLKKLQITKQMLNITNIL